MNNIILCGFMGSGKTVVGKELAKMTGRRFVDTDELVEKKQGIPIKAIFEIYGEDYFRDLEYEVCRESAALKNTVISTGGGAVTYERNVQALREGGKIIFLDADFETVCERIGDSTTRPLFQDKEKARALFDARRPLYEAAADITLDGSMSAYKTAMEIAQMLK